MSGDGETWVRPTTDEWDDVVSEEIDLAARDGVVPALLYRPAHPTAARLPGVVIGAEAYGVNDFSRRVAATLAHLGAVVVVPDYYRGDGLADPEAYHDFTEVIARIERLDFTLATLDLVAGVDHLEARGDVDASRVAVWGYCTGGTLAWLAACLCRELAAAVLFFPSQPVFAELGPTRPVHPVNLLWAIACPTLFIYGEEDAVVSPELADDLQRRIEGWQVTAEVRRYPGAGHAFSAPVAPLRHEEADRAAWQDALDFAHRHLRFSR